MVWEPDEQRRGSLDTAERLITHFSTSTVLTDIDGSDAGSDWPFLNALLNTASGATWVSFHHGGGVGMGFAQHAGLVIVCDGSKAAARRIERVLTNDPATGVMRHADAGYETAKQCAREHGLNLPMLDD